MTQGCFDSLSVHQLYPKWLTAHASGRDCCIVDVRTPGEFAAGHIPGARLLPLDRLQGLLHELPKQSDIHLLCHSGMRSRQAALLLFAGGFTRLSNIEGGTVAWIAAGYPVDSAAGGAGKAA